MAKTKTDRYVGRTAEQVEINGRSFTAAIHWAMVGGQVRCVGLDLRAFTSRNAAKVDLSDAAPLGPWSEVTSPVVRNLRVAEVIEQSRKDYDGLRQAVAALPEPVRKSLGRPAGKQRKQPGPPTRYTDQVLREVVAPAYRVGGRKPALAVQEALAVHFGELVTPDMARKAVRKAREAGHLPAYDGGNR